MMQLFEEDKKGVPFIWSNLNEYVEIVNPENKITKDSFNKLSEEDKGRYRVNPKENVFTLFNLDQTTLPLFTRIHIRRISMIPGRLHRMMRKSYA